MHPEFSVTRAHDLQQFATICNVSKHTTLITMGNVMLEGVLAFFLCVPVSASLVDEKLPTRVLFGLGHTRSVAFLNLSPLNCFRSHVEVCASTLMLSELKGSKFNLPPGEGPKAKMLGGSRAARLHE